MEGMTPRQEAEFANLNDTKVAGSGSFAPGETWYWEKNGDAGFLITAGLLSGSRKSIQFSLITPKNLDYIKSVKINVMKVNIRHSDGGYLPQTSGYVTGGVELADYGTLIAEKASSNCIGVKLDLTTASSFTNNCPLVVSVEELSITFS